MRLPTSFQWRVAISYSGLILLALGVISYYLFTLVKDTYLSNLETRLTQEAQLLARSSAGLIEGETATADIEALSSQTGGLVQARVTIVDRDGSVLVDTWDGIGSGEDHSGRPEIRTAMAGEVGQSTRFSSTASQNMMYIAVPIEIDGNLAGVARLAVPASEIRDELNRITATVAFSGLIVAVLSVGLGVWLAHRTSRPLKTLQQGARRLAAGDLQHGVPTSALDETRELGEALNLMARNLRSSIQTVAEERNKLAIVLDTMVDGVVVIGPDQRADLLNPAARELLSVGETGRDGTSSGDTAGSVWAAGAGGMAARWGLLYPDIRRLIETCRQQRVRQHASFELTSLQRVVDAVATPLEDGSSPAGVLLTLHDLTPMRQMESSQKEFVSNVSHELRNPLASMKAMVETLEDGALSEREVAQDFLRRIHQDIDRMTALGNDLLDLSRLESGQPVLELAPVDLPSLMYEVQSQFASLARAKGIGLKVHSEEPVLRALGDRQRLRQVLVNLAENALKFTREGGEVSVAVHARGSFVQVVFSDTGPGIAPEHLPHIFDRFYKTDRSRRDGGTGLGLAIVKQIITAHGGEIVVESQEDSGSTFRLTVPAAE